MTSWQGSGLAQPSDSGGAPHPTVRRIQPSEPAYAGERRLRWELLRRPLGMPLGSEEFAAEADCLHWAACLAEPDGLRVVGCVLFVRRSPDSGRLLQMAVAPGWRRRGVGRALVRRLEEDVAELGVVRVRLHARLEAVSFYRALGYSVRGRAFWEVGIGHRHMERRLARPTAP